MKRYVVVGLGNFGSLVCESLHARGNEVIAVDMHEDVIDRIAPHATRSAVADGTDPDVLRRLGAEHADGGVVSTGADISASILAVMALKDLKVQSIIAKVVSRQHERVMNKLGADETVFPERDTAQNLVARLLGPALLNFVKLGPDFGLQEMAVPRAWENKSLRVIDPRRNHGVLVVGVHDVLTDTTRSPNPDDVLTDSDGLIVSGRLKDLETVAQVK